MFYLCEGAEFIKTDFIVCSSMNLFTDAEQKVLILCSRVWEEAGGGNRTAGRIFTQ